MRKLNYKGAVSEIKKLVAHSDMTSGESFADDVEKARFPFEYLSWGDRGQFAMILGIVGTTFHSVKSDLETVAVIEGSKTPLVFLFNVINHRTSRPYQVELCFLSTYYPFPTPPPSCATFVCVIKPISLRLN